MSRAGPATPAKGAYDNYMHVALPMVSSSASKVPSHGPSPASTYGQTATSSSVPSSPLDCQGFNGGHGVQIASSSSAHTPRSNQKHPFEDKLLNHYTTPTKAKGNQAGSFVPLPVSTANDPFTQAPIVQSSNAVAPGLLPAQMANLSINHVQPVISTTAYGLSPEQIAQLPVNESGQTVAEKREEAQGVYPAKACIFVANLNSSSTDVGLAAKLESHSHFGRFGRCWAKVKRDAGRNNMPYAFLQFETPEAATNALEEGNSMNIDGRLCRVEPAKVLRTVWATRVDGNYFDVQQVLDLLRAYGPIESYFVPTQQEAASNRVPFYGAYVQFCVLNHCQTALAGMRNHHTFIVQLSNFPNPGLSGNNAARQPRPVPTAQPSIYGSSSVAHLQYRLYPTRMIFVDNLPVDTNYHALVNLFSTYGEVHALHLSMALPIVQLFNEQNKREIVSGLHATVEYQDAASAANAVRNQDMKVHGGRKIRVVFKLDHMHVHDGRYPDCIYDANTLTIPHGATTPFVGNGLMSPQAYAHF